MLTRHWFECSTVCSQSSQRAFPGIVVYIILALVIPERPSQTRRDSHDEWSEY
ncbi:PspC domain-containing protein [Latilactobacillus sakei]